MTRPTPLELAPLAHSPYVSCSYWDPAHDVAVAECRAGRAAAMAPGEPALTRAA